MKTTYQIIRPPGLVEKVEAEFSDDEDKRAEETLAVLNKFIPPGYIEHVNVFWEGKYMDMFVDEDGHRKRLPVNIWATKIYWNNTIVHQPELADELTEMIVGDAVLFKKGVVT